MRTTHLALGGDHADGFMTRDKRELGDEFALVNVLYDHRVSDGHACEAPHQRGTRKLASARAA